MHQGSVLSLLLFVIVMEPIYREFRVMHTYIHTNNHFTALLNFVLDYAGEPAPER